MSLLRFPNRFLYRLVHRSLVWGALLLYSAAGKVANAQDCAWLNVSNRNTSSGYSSAAAIATDKNNNAIVVGGFFNDFSFGTHTYTSANNGYIARFNDTGKFLWGNQSYGGLVSGNATSFYDVATDANDNIYVCGISRPTATVHFGNGISLSDSSGKRVIFLLKYNASGVAQWVREIGLSSLTANYSSAILAVDKDNNVVITFDYTDTIYFKGTTTSYTAPAGNHTVVVAKYTSSGTLLSSNVFGGPGYERPCDIDCDGEGRIYITALSSDDFSFGLQTLAGDGLAIIKLSPSLIPVKGIKISAPTAGSLNNFTGIAVRKNGYFAVSGNFNNPLDFGGITLSKSSTQAVFIAFYTPDLTPVWVKRDFPNTGCSTWSIGGVKLYGDYIYTGGYIDGPGTRFGTMTLPGSSYGVDCAYLLKMDTLGNFLWGFSNAAAPHRSIVSNLAVDNGGNVYIAGSWGGSITIFNKTAGSGTSPQLQTYAAKITDYTISRGTVSPGPYCAGDTIKVPYTETGNYEPGNEFIAQLSDSAGSFDGDERELGRLTSATGDTIKGLIPLLNIASNNKYRIRIISTKPQVQSFYKLDNLRLLIYSKDTANAGSDIRLCKGSSVKLQTTGGSKWQWSPPVFMADAADTARRYAVVKPDSTTEYRIIISDSSGCGVTDTDYVAVNVLNETKITLPDTVRYCTGTTAIVQVQVTGGYAPTQTIMWWEDGDGNKTPLSTTHQLSVSPLIKTYWVLVKDSCFSDSARVVVIRNNPLKITLNADTTICVGQTARLRAAMQGGDTTAHTVQWVAQGSLWTGSNPVENVSPLVTTIYKAFLTDGCTPAPDSATITIAVRPPLKVTIKPDTVLCMGQTTQLRATGTGGFAPGYKIQWLEINGPFTSNNWHETVNPAATTVYKALLTDGCTTPPDSAIITVTVRPPLKIIVNPDTTVCTGQSTQLRATTTGGYTPSHQVLWKDGSGFYVNGNTIMVNPLSTITYTAALSDGCTSQNDSAMITVTVRPPLQVSINAPDSICSNKTLQLEAIVQGGYAPGYTFNWSNSSGLWSPVQNPATDTPQTTTTYTITVSDNCSPNIQAAKTITVLPVPVAGFDITPAKGCPPLNVNFTDQSTVNDTLLNTWKIELAETTGTATHNQTFTQAGTYGVGLTVSNPLGCANSIYKPGAITVYEKPQAAFAVKPQLKEELEPLWLYNYSKKATTYVWDFDNGITLFQTTRNDTTYTYADTGNFIISLVARNTNGCSDTARQAIRIFGKINCAVPSGFTPNADNLNDEFGPVCSGVANYTLTVFNRWGQVLLNCQNCLWNGTYAGEPAEQGIYLFKLEIDGQSRQKTMLYGVVNLLR